MPSQHGKMDIHVLIVDDDEAIRDSMNEVIKNAGYQSAVASNGEEALELLKKTEFDIVITDIMMPGMNGLELTDRIKREYQTNVIVMTGYGGDYSYEEAIYKGASDFVFKPVRFEELLLRVKRVLNEQDLERDRYEMVEKLKELAITDGLTKLYNSRYFYSQLEIEVDRANRYKHPLSILLLDIDNLKPYNDTYGHLEGDKVLARFGQIIKSRLRKMDSAYRYGGDEFTVILPSTKGDEAAIVAERIRFSLEKEEFNPVPLNSVSLTVSIGAAEYARDEDLNAFVQRVDKNMYTSKHLGGNVVSLTKHEDTQ